MFGPILDMLEGPEGEVTHNRRPARTPATTARTVARFDLGPALRRASLAMLMALAFIVLAQAAAGAREGAPSPNATKIAGQGWEGEGCGPFSLTQTYSNWGPARFYGQAVTVSYQATRCSRDRGETVHLTIEGVASVYKGTQVKGAPLDQRSFFVSGRWTGATNPEGWPPEWWQCGVDAAAYTWRISGVYTFAVTAREGSWSLDVSVGGKTVHWTYDACG